MGLTIYSIFFSQKYQTTEFVQHPVRGPLHNTYVEMIDVLQIMTVHREQGAAQQHAAKGAAKKSASNLFFQVRTIITWTLSTIIGTFQI